MDRCGGPGYGSGSGFTFGKAMSFASCWRGCPAKHCRSLTGAWASAQSLLSRWSSSNQKKQGGSSLTPPAAPLPASCDSRQQFVLAVLTLFSKHGGNKGHNSGFSFATWFGIAATAALSTPAALADTSHSKNEAPVPPAVLEAWQELHAPSCSFQLLRILACMQTSLHSCATTSNPTSLVDTTTHSDNSMVQQQSSEDAALVTSADWRQQLQALDVLSQATADAAVAEHVNQTRSLQQSGSCRMLSWLSSTETPDVEAPVAGVINTDAAPMGVASVASQARKGVCVVPDDNATCSVDAATHIAGVNGWTSGPEWPILASCASVSECQFGSEAWSIVSAAAGQLWQPYHVLQEEITYDEANRRQTTEIIGESSLQSSTSPAGSFNPPTTTVEAHGNGQNTLWTHHSDRSATIFDAFVAPSNNCTDSSNTQYTLQVESKCSTASSTATNAQSDAAASRTRFVGARRRSVESVPTSSLLTDEFRHRPALAAIPEDEPAYAANDASLSVPEAVIYPVIDHESTAACIHPAGQHMASCELAEDAAVALVQQSSQPTFSAAVTPGHKTETHVAAGFGHDSGTYGQPTSNLKDSDNPCRLDVQGVPHMALADTVGHVGPITHHGCTPSMRHEPADASFSVAASISGLDSALHTSNVSQLGVSLAPHPTAAWTSGMFARFLEWRQSFLGLQGLDVTLAVLGVPSVEEQARQDLCKPESAFRLDAMPNVMQVLEYDMDDLLSQASGIDDGLRHFTRHTKASSWEVAEQHLDDLQEFFIKSRTILVRVPPCSESSRSQVFQRVVPPLVQCGRVCSAGLSHLLGQQRAGGQRLTKADVSDQLGLVHKFIHLTAQISQELREAEVVVPDCDYAQELGHAAHEVFAALTNFVPSLQSSAIASLSNIARTRSTSAELDRVVAMTRVWKEAHKLRILMGTVWPELQGSACSQLADCHRHAVEAFGRLLKNPQQAQRKKGGASTPPGPITTQPSDDPGWSDAAGVSAEEVARFKQVLQVLWSLLHYSKATYKDLMLKEQKDKADVQRHISIQNAFFEACLALTRRSSRWTSSRLRSAPGPLLAEVKRSQSEVLRFVVEWDKSCLKAPGHKQMALLQDTAFRLVKQYMALQRQTSSRTDSLSTPRRLTSETTETVTPGHPLPYPDTFHPTPSPNTTHQPQLLPPPSHQPQPLASPFAHPNLQFRAASLSPGARSPYEGISNGPHQEATNGALHSLTSDSPVPSTFHPDNPFAMLQHTGIPLLPSLSQNQIQTVVIPDPTASPQIPHLATSFLTANLPANSQVSTHATGPIVEDSAHLRCLAPSPPALPSPFVAAQASHVSTPNPTPRSFHHLDCSYRNPSPSPSDPVLNAYPSPSYPSYTPSPSPSYPSLNPSPSPMPSHSIDGADSSPFNDIALHSRLESVIKCFTPRQQINTPTPSPSLPTVPEAFYPQQGDAESHSSGLIPTSAALCSNGLIPSSHQGFMPSNVEGLKPGQDQGHMHSHGLHSQGLIPANYSAYSPGLIPTPGMNSRNTSDTSSGTTRDSADGQSSGRSHSDPSAHGAVVTSTDQDRATVSPTDQDGQSTAIIEQGHSHCTAGCASPSNHSITPVANGNGPLAVPALSAGAASLLNAAAVTVRAGGDMLVSTPVKAAGIAGANDVAGNQLGATAAAMQNMNLIDIFLSPQSSKVGGDSLVMTTSFIDDFWGVKWEEVLGANVREWLTGKTMLGKGSYGEVYKACYYHSDVAVKVLPIRSSTLQTVKQEIDVLRRNHHPNIVRFLGACLEPLQPGQAPKPTRHLAVVMELCDIGTLHTIINKSRHIAFRKRDRHVRDFYSSWLTRLHIAKGIAAGTAFLHSHNVVHRDLTSYNVLLHYGSPWQAKVADFGLSRHATHELNYSGDLHSPGWRAPELLTTDSKYTSKADVFSFGVILWELLTLRQPWDAEFDKAGQAGPRGNRPLFIKNEVVAGNRLPFPDAEDLESELPEATQVVSLAERCWEQNPDLRPTMEEAASKLEKVIAKLERTRGRRK